jgi:hypothetical protein
MHAVSHDVTHTQDANASVTVLTLAMSTTGIPAVFKALVGSSLSIVDSRSWQPVETDGAYQGYTSVTTAVRKRQLQVKGGMKLVPRAEGCQFTLSAVVTAKIPIAAGQAARQVHGLALEILADQSALLNGWLSDPSRRARYEA